MKYGLRESFTCPTPKPRYGSGPKIWMNDDGTMTCEYDLPRRRRMALDQARPGPDDDDALEELSRLLRENLAPDVLSHVEQLIVHLLGAGPDANSPDAVLTNDEPVPFRGMPRRPGIDNRRHLAGDSAGSAKLDAYRAAEASLRLMFPTMRIPRQL